VLEQASKQPNCQIGLAAKCLPFAHKCFLTVLTDWLTSSMNPSIHQSINQQLHNTNKHTRRVALALLQRFSSFATILFKLQRLSSSAGAGLSSSPSTQHNCHEFRYIVLQGPQQRRPRVALHWMILIGWRGQNLWVVEPGTHYAIVLNSWMPGDVVVCNRATHTIPLY
jgi:hypothetical protein